MSGATWGWIGGILGAVLGTLGGAVGTYFSIKNTKGPRERAFMVRCAVIAWIAIFVFVGLLVLIPSPYRFLLWVPYGVVLPLAIRFCNRKQEAIRKAEGQAEPDSA